MIFETYEPRSPVNRVIERFMVLESEYGGHKQLLPDTSLVLALSIRGKLFSDLSQEAPALPSASLSGLRSTPKIVRYGEKASILLVFFRESGAASLFTQPIHEVFGTTQALNEMLPSGDAQWLEERVGQAATNVQRVAVVVRYFLQRLQNYEEDTLVSAAIRRMRELGGGVRIHDLVEELPISVDGFEKRFRRSVGSTPKQFLSILRLRRLMERHASGSKWMDEAYSAGYYDEAHFIKHFKKFTGTTPRAFSGIPTFKETRG